MRDLLRHIPKPTPFGDSWQGTALPPLFVPVEATAAPAWFVDGGNAAILHAPHFSLQQLRAVAIHMPSKQMHRAQAKALLVRKKDSWHIRFEDGTTTDFVGEQEDAITFARKLLEHAVAKKALAENNGIVVLDGDEAPPGCLALQKSITTLSDNGYSLSSVLTTNGPWYATLGSVTAVKLHARAWHVFLLHHGNSQHVAQLAHHSADSLFPGYPYGLILADKLARVSKEEAQALRTHAKAMLKDLTPIVAQAEAATDSHSILDSL